MMTDGSCHILATAENKSHYSGYFITGNDRLRPFEYFTTTWVKTYFKPLKQCVIRIDVDVTPSNG